jgi:type I restriction enzyme, S subunit
LRLKNDVEVDFINSFLNSYIFWSQIIEMKSGSAMPNVNAEKLKTLRIPKCDNKLQRTFVALTKENQMNSDLKVISIKLNSIEKFYNNKNLFSTELSLQLDLVKQLRQAFLREAMQGKLTAKWRKENRDLEPASELLKKIKAEKEKLIKEGKIKKQKPLPSIKEDEIPFDIPESWEWCRLGEIVNLVTSGSRDWAKYYTETGAKFVRMGNLSKESYNLRLNKIQYVTPPKNSEGKRTRLEENDLLISITGEVGNLGLIPKNFGEAYINQHTGLVRLNNQIETLYVANCFLSALLKQQFNEPQRGLKNSFRLTDIDYLLIPLPPKFEQQQIVTKLDELMQYCDKLEESIKTSRQQNEMLLQQVLREALEPKN